MRPIPFSQADCLVEWLGGDDEEWVGFAWLTACDHGRAAPHFGGLRKIVLDHFGGLKKLCWVPSICGRFWYLFRAEQQVL